MLFKWQGCILVEINVNSWQEISKNSLYQVVLEADGKIQQSSTKWL